MTLSRVLTLSRSQFQELFTAKWSTAWRWECQGVYREPTEQEPLRRFLLGDRDLSWYRPWRERVRAWVAEGRHIARVRMLTDPLTDYLRYQLFLTVAAVDAGEDILFIDEERADELGAPKEDYWIFDDTKVVTMSFNDDGVNSATLITNPEVVCPYVEWRATVTPVAFPYTTSAQ
jgi:hypothetical protein